MADKGTEISLGKDGFSFKTDGEASQRLANAALDFLSPITEGAGFLGTKLRGYRMEAALEATIRAKAICKENNLSINPVPPKFLLQWVEGASMEDIEGEDNLVELWARVLCAEVTTGDPNALIFVDILRKIHKEHAEYLSGMFKNTDDKLLRNVRKYIGQDYYEEVIIETLLKYEFPYKHFDKEEELTKELMKQLAVPGSYNFYLYVSDLKTQANFENCALPLLGVDFNSRPVSIHSSLHDSLRLLGVIEDFKHNFHWKTGALDFEVSMFSRKLTALGWEFVFACGIAEAGL